MIRIDRISFDFTAPDEPFVRGLYAGWDDFCRSCFEQVVEACCAAYDKSAVLHEIEQLELDLGSISEAEFYREFPLRLREALLKALPPLNLPTPAEAERSAASRRDNLLFFLRYGYPKPEWADQDFDASVEARWLLTQSAALQEPFIVETARLCLEQGYALHRLLRQTDCGEMHLRVYAAALVAPSAGLHQKRRFLALMLEENPDIPVRFVHLSGSDSSLQGMAALLDSPTVLQLMRTEMKEHAEVDLPPYWHYLYEWLIRYYPFNGLAVFGGKAAFTLHLHHRLLTFIRKRSDSPYLSKAELTLNFLREVFGTTYYKEVLNAIYGLQPRRADGSPAYDGYFNRELYRIFMHLSLLEPSDVGKKETSGEETAASPEVSADKVKLRLRQALLDAFLPEAIKRREIAAFWEAYGENPAEAITLLTALLQDAEPAGDALDTLAEYLPAPLLWQGLAKANFYQASVLSRVAEQMEHHADAFPFLVANGISLSAALSKALLCYMQDADTWKRTLTEKEIIEKFLSFLYLIYKGEGGSNHREEARGRLSAEKVMPEGGLRETTGREKQEIVETSSVKEYPEAELQKYIQFLMENQTANLSAWPEEYAGNKEMLRVANVADIALLEQRMADLLTATNFVGTASFRRSAMWLPYLLRFHPQELLAHIRRSVSAHSQLLTQWMEWLDVRAWRSLAASLSLSVAELLRQVAEVLHWDEHTQLRAWSLCLTTGRKEEEWTYNSSEENIRSFVQALSSGQGRDEANEAELVRRIKEELHLRDEEVAAVADVPEFLWVGNAGLCLLAPWLPRLFGVLGYLDEDRKKLKDTASKVRAVFLLQYLVYGEEREHREAELAFNRLLTGLSLHVPLPKQLPLTEEEKQTADSLTEGAKANWSQLKGTSVRGFRQSFIARGGTLEQQEERWVLTVEKKPHDVLLESVPWSFRQIRLPWLEKYVQVVWNEKQEFS